MYNVNTYIYPSLFFFILHHVRFKALVFGVPIKCETKRNQRKRNEINKNETKRNQRNENEMKRKQNEIN